MRSIGAATLLPARILLLGSGQDVTFNKDVLPSCRQMSELPPPV